MVTLLLDLSILDFLHDSVFLLLNGTVSLSCSSARRQCKPDRCFIVTILFFMLTSCYFLSMPVFFFAFHFLSFLLFHWSLFSMAFFRPIAFSILEVEVPPYDIPLSPNWEVVVAHTSQLVSVGQSLLIKVIYIACLQEKS